MRKMWLFFSILSVWSAFVNPLRPHAQGKPIVRLDPTLDALISPDAKLELVKTGFGFTEGVTWVQHGRSGYLLFSDIRANVIYKMRPDGKATIYLNHSGSSKPDIGKAIRMSRIIGSDGLALDGQSAPLDRIATYGGDRSIDPASKKTVSASPWPSVTDGNRFDGPNDVVVKKDGAIYFTDSLGGMQGRDKDPAREMDHPGRLHD